MTDHTGILIAPAWILFVCCPILATYHEGTWGEKSLIKDLLHDYEKRARPVVDGVSKEIKLGDSLVQQITVEFGLALVQILQLNENEQILTVSVKSLYRWPDYHLIWNPEDYENITYITIPTSKIWVPDIALYNYADERLEELRDCAARVNHNGIIEWSPMAIYKSTCPVKIKYFPYDKQNCNLRFGPWTYDNARVNVSIYESKWDLKDYVVSPEWRLLDHSVSMRERQYPCCPETYSDMIFQITIERQPAYYNYLLILPCFLLSSLTLVLFWLPPETPAKMVLGMNIFLAFFLLLLLLEDSIPSASSSFPLIGNYYCINMTLVTVSTFLCLIVVNLHFRGDRQTAVPPWLRKLAIQHGARLLFVNVAPPKPTNQKSPNKKTFKMDHPDSMAKSGEGIQSNRSKFGYYPGFGMHYGDASYNNPNYPRPFYPMPAADRVQLSEGFPFHPRWNPYLRPKHFPQEDAVSPYSPDPNFFETPYSNYAEPYNRLMDYQFRQSFNDDPNRVNAFCPACAGLAVAAAASSSHGRLGCNEVNDALPKSPMEPTLNRYLDDPAEQLAAVWSAAMNAPGPQAKSLEMMNSSEYTGHRAQYMDKEGKANVYRTASDGRSTGADLECFLLECIRPRSARKETATDNITWDDYSRSRINESKHSVQPPSPFYEFKSPHCEEDPDDISSQQQWPTVAGTDGKTDADVREEDEESIDSGDQRLWRSYSGRSSHGHEKSNPVLKDPLILKRVRTVKHDVSDIVRGIRFMQRLNENKERVNKTIAEWRMVGMVLDRLFFVIYLCALGISIMVYFPRSGDDLEDQT